MSLLQPTTISLKSLNTFGIDARAEGLVQAHSIQELKTALSSAGKKVLILGGGSNTLFTGNFDGTVIQPSIRYINIIEETNDYALLEVGAGVGWHALVMYTVAEGLGGLENLSLIPGWVGAAPMQNIGAYGVEVKDTITHVQAVNRETLETTTFTNAECQFGYRESIFKREAAGKYVITSVRFRLKKQAEVNVSYGAIKDTLAELGIAEPTIADVSRAVIAIRQSKLPDPKKIGNAGSFFKNPEVEQTLAESIKSKHPGIPTYPAAHNRIKLPAGWLIEQAGWKGYRSNGTGVHDKQALVLVNHGGAQGGDVIALARQIQADVETKFGVHLEMEVNAV